MKTKTNENEPKEKWFDLFLELTGMTRGWTPVSNPLLRATMDKDQPTGYRVLSWLILHSWGLPGRDKCEYAMFENRAARQIDMGAAKELDMTPDHLSQVIARLEKEGRIRIDAGRYYVLTDPIRKSVKDKLDPVAEYEHWAAPARLAFLEVKYPKVAKMGLRAAKLYNDYRSKKHKIFQEFDAQPDEERSKYIEEQKEKAAIEKAARKKLSAQSTKMSAHSTKSGVRTRPLLIEEVNRKKKAPLTSASSSLVSECIQIRDSLTHWYGFQLADADTIPEQLAKLAAAQKLSVAELDAWMREKAEDAKKRRYKITSPGAVLSFARTDLAPWAKENAAMLDAYRQQTAEPEPPPVETREETREERLARYRAALAAETRPKERRLIQNMITELEQDNGMSKGATP